MIPTTECRDSVIHRFAHLFKNPILINCYWWARTENVQFTVNTSNAVFPTTIFFFFSEVRNKKKNLFSKNHHHSLKAEVSAFSRMSKQEAHFCVSRNKTLLTQERNFRTSTLQPLRVLVIYASTFQYSHRNMYCNSGKQKALAFFAWWCTCYRWHWVQWCTLQWECWLVVVTRGRQSYWTSPEVWNVCFVTEDLN